MSIISTCMRARGRACVAKLWERVIDGGGRRRKSWAAGRGQKWRVGVSIPLPTACEAVALPFELTPQNRHAAAPRLPVRRLRPQQPPLPSAAPPQPRTTTAACAPRPPARGRSDAAGHLPPALTQAGQAQGEAIALPCPAPPPGTQSAQPFPYRPLHHKDFSERAVAPVAAGGPETGPTWKNRTFWKK